MDFRLFRRPNGKRPAPRREISRPSATAVLVERGRRIERHAPLGPDPELEEALERWLDPEVISRSAVEYALWDYENHWWARDAKACRCGVQIDDDSVKSMRHHRQDILAAALGLTIK